MHDNDVQPDVLDVPVNVHAASGGGGGGGGGDGGGDGGGGSVRPGVGIVEQLVTPEHDVLPVRAYDLPTDGSKVEVYTADHLKRESDPHDFAVYREAVAMFAFKLCSYGFIIPPDLVHLVRMLPWKKPLNPKCFPAA